MSRILSVNCLGEKLTRHAQRHPNASLKVVILLIVVVVVVVVSTSIIEYHVQKLALAGPFLNDIDMFGSSTVSSSTIRRMIPRHGLGKLAKGVGLAMADVTARQEFQIDQPHANCWL